MSPFFRPGPGPYALAITMTGARPGEHLLQIGSGTPGMFGALAAKVGGVTGQAAAVAADPLAAAALKRGGAQAGALVDVQVASPAALPYDDGTFDLVVLDCTAMPIDKGAEWLPEAFRVLRAGGRLIVAERTGGWRLWGVFEIRSPRGDAGAATRALETNRFRPVRKIAERDAWRFTEGLKPGI
jgi:SAM-dependent methyltransferase